MIKKLLDINLKGTNKNTHILVLIVISMMVTYIKLSILYISHTQTLCMGDILILVFGGLNKGFDIAYDFSMFVIWIIPNIIVIYLINVGIIHKLRKTTSLILPRTKKKINWIISFNAAVCITILKYYLILFSASLITIFLRMGTRAFLNKNILPNNYNQLILSTNHCLIILYMFVLNVFTMMYLVIFMNNVYHIFLKSNHAAIIGMIVCFITVIAIKSDKISKFILLNQAMLIRHDLFKGGFEKFNLLFSVIYLCIFGFINFLLNILIIKRRDIIDI